MSLTLQGRALWAVLAGTALVGAGVGVFAAGWRSARGLPPMQASADAGVALQLDAGVQSKCECAASIEHWSRIEVPVPGPTRYIRGDAGVVEIHTVETVTILVPEVRVTGAAGAVAALQGSGTAQAGAGVKIGDVPRVERRSGSVTAMPTLDTAGRWGGEIGLGVRVVEDWWLASGASWTPGKELRGGLGIRKDF